MKHLLFLVILTWCVGTLFSQNHPLYLTEGNQRDAQIKWVDSVYNVLSLEEKIGQLFVVDVFSNKDKTHFDHIKSLIKNEQIGGLIFSKGGPVRQAKLINEFQSLSKIPLQISMDAEWGLAMRLDSTYAFPWNMTLGAIQDDVLVEKTGYLMGKHAKRLGVHMNFSPVVDINTNPKNPIIGNRSFGENKENVARKSIALIKGMHRAGTLTNAKHFPGHGDTDQDSHKTLPSISFSEARIKEVELFPFEAIFKEGVTSVMVAHLNVPSLEKRDKLPTSLSYRVVTELLQDELGFEGLIYTDALNMKGVSEYDLVGEVDLMAFLAGNDVMLISESVPEAKNVFIKAYENGSLTEERLSHSVKKMLLAKYKSGLQFKPFVGVENLVEDLLNKENEELERQLFEASITVVKNDLGVLPLSKTSQRIGYLNLGKEYGDAFLVMAKNYHPIIIITKNDISSQIERLDHLIIGYHQSDSSPWKSFQMSSEEIELIDGLARQKPTTLLNFTSPYALLDVKSFLPLEAIVQAYQNKSVSQEIAAQVIFGALGTSGKLPVSINSVFPEGTGFKLKPTGRLGYDFSKNVGFNEEKLKKIDTLISQIKKEKMAPGGQVLIARKGKIVYNKSFGTLRYGGKQSVTDSTLYDLASLTKILGTLPLVMMLEEQNNISLESDLQYLFPDKNLGNKASLSIKQLLSHYARLKAWIPFYLDTLQNQDCYYKNEKSEEFAVRITDSLFLRTDFRDTIFQQIVDSDLLLKKEYKYSDLPYYFLKEYVERELNGSIPQLTNDYFYKPMGIEHLTYFPLEKFDTSQIAPSEVDLIWRKQEVLGEVNDQGAAMLGGVGGHAGLFGNAKSVAQMMQLFLNFGSYGGINYLQPNTIQRFNTCYYCDDKVRRGVGFDKPQLEKDGPTCGCVSLESFGHSGYTGTYTWADPEHEIIYVFLSNRTYPSATNQKLIKKNIRTEIQQVIYDAIED